MSRRLALGLVLTTVASLAIAVSLIIWARWHGRKPAAVFPGEGVSLPAKEEEPLNQSTLRLPMAKSVPSAGAKDNQPFEAAGFLERLGPRPRFKDTPVMDVGTQQELIRHYEALASFTDKNRILRVLAFQGTPELVRPLLERAVIEEYAGQELDPVESAQLAYVLQLIGILAARDEASLAFLMKHTSRRAWAGKTLWQIRSGGQSEPVPSHILVSEAIQGLGMSGRSEVADWLEAVKRGAQLEAREFPGAVLSAAFLWRVVNTKGLEYVLDEVVYSPEQATIAYHEWKLTSEGTDWDKWYDACLRSQK